MDRVDIAIIGGGIAGLSLAAFLGDRQSVAVLEQEAAPGYHATGRSAAEFVLNYNPPAICDLARASKPFFDHPPEGFSTVPLLVRRGGLVIAGPAKIDRLRAQFESLRGQVEGLAWLSPEEAHSRAPFLDPALLGGAYFDPDYWDIEVDTLMHGYMRMAKRAGQSLLLKAGLRSATRVGGFWHLETTAGPLEARVIVNAAGGWADQVATLCGARPLGIVPHRRTAALVDLPDGIDAGSLPEINEVDDLFYFKPDGGRLFISPADETPCEPCDIQPEEIDVAWAVHHLESVSSLRVRRVAKSWAGMRTFSPDRLPVVGFDRDCEGFFWLAGQGGFGILTSPALGQLAAGMLCGQSGGAVFDPQRF